MNWQKELLICSLAAAGLASAGCGVKGDPLPPERPPELGRGRPTYKRATEGITIKKTTDKQDEDDGDDSKN